VGVSATYNIECIFETEGVMKFEDQSKANHLFLIVQEAVNNAVKHSKCTKISIKSEACKGKNVISISDDGEGLNGSSNGGHGFRIMHYRASVIGAELCIGNSKKGTVVSISFDS
jgi:signal transduction histidine kinase